MDHITWRKAWRGEGRVVRAVNLVQVGPWMGDLSWPGSHKLAKVGSMFFFWRETCRSTGHFTWRQAWVGHRPVRWRETCRSMGHFTWRQAWVGRRSGHGRATIRRRGYMPWYVGLSPKHTEKSRYTIFNRHEQTDRIPESFKNIYNGILSIWITNKIENIKLH